MFFFFGLVIDTADPNGLQCFLRKSVVFPQSNVGKNNLKITQHTCLWGICKGCLHYFVPSLQFDFHHMVQSNAFRIVTHPALTQLRKLSYCITTRQSTSQFFLIRMIIISQRTSLTAQRSFLWCTFSFIFFRYNLLFILFLEEEVGKSVFHSKEHPTVLHCKLRGDPYVKGIWG